MRGKPFQKGFDPRRHLLTHADRRLGYQRAPSRIKARIRCLYRGCDGISRIVKKGERIYDELAF